jgi:uncharacterized membrane protein
VRPTILAAVAVAATFTALVVASCGGGSDSGSSSKAASLEDVQEIAEQRCVPCHSATPTSTMFDSPPAGLELDKPENIEARKDRIYELVVVRKEMPFANQTKMTQAERDVFASWYRAGAKK